MKPILFLSVCLFFLTASLQLQAQWYKTQSPEGGTVEGFVRIGDTIIANAGRLYFSTDAGENWQALPSDNGLRSGQLHTDGKNLLLRSYVPELRANKLFFSADRGENWTAVPSPDSLRFSLFEISGTYIYGAHYNAIYRTTDLGQHWEYWPYTGPGFIDHVFLDDSGWMIATHRYLLRASDPGQPWDTLLPIEHELEALYKDGDTLLAIHGYYDWLFHRSTDGGQHWDLIGQNVLPEKEFIFLADGGTLYALGNCYTSSYRSDDWGQTWTPLNQPIPCTTPLAGTASGDTLLTATRRRGILRSTDGGLNWNLANKGMRALQPENIRSIEGQLYAMQTDGLYRLEVNGQDWGRMPVSDSLMYPFNDHHFQDLAKTDTGFIAMVDNRLYRLNEQLSDWGRIYDAEQQEVEHTTVFRMSKVQDEVAGATTGESFYLLSSRDNGRYFKTFYPGAGLPSSTEIIAFTDSFLYLLEMGGRIFRSDDLGDTWVVQADVDLISYFGLDGGLNDFWVAGGAIFIIRSIFQNAEKMLFSPDLGATWFFYDLLAGERPWGASDFTSLLEYQGTLLATTHNGIFVSQDQGLNWTPWNEGLEWLPARSLAIHDGFVWTGILGDGIWKRPLSDLSFLGINPITRKNLEIWPNPARQTAQVLLPFPGELQVMDPLGRVVYRMQSEQVSALLPLADWTPGLYRVVLHGMHETLSGSFIKN